MSAVPVGLYAIDEFTALSEPIDEHSLEMSTDLQKDYR